MSTAPTNVAIPWPLVGNTGHGELTSWDLVSMGAMRVTVGALVLSGILYVCRMHRGRNRPAPIYIYGRCNFIMGDSTGGAHQKVVVKPGNPELDRAAIFSFFDA